MIWALHLEAFYCSGSGEEQFPCTTELGQIMHGEKTHLANADLLLGQGWTYLFKITCCVVNLLKQSMVQHCLKRFFLCMFLQEKLNSKTVIVLKLNLDQVCSGLMEKTLLHNLLLRQSIPARIYITLENTLVYNKALWTSKSKLPIPNMLCASIHKNKVLQLYSKYVF